MALLSLSNVSKSFGDRVLFDSISFTIEDKHRIGLVGINGSGKSTLFKIIQGEVSMDDGEIFKSKNTSIGYVDQFSCSNSNLTVYEEALTIFNFLIDVENRLSEIQIQLERNVYDEALLIEKHSLEELYDKSGGYTFRSITKSTLIGLGFKEVEFDMSVQSLSGGQKTKLMLAKLLLSNSNLLLLDEPTNNLDIEAIEWLEDFLLSYKGSYIVISHDRYFLDKVTTETFELESKRLSVYKGNYSKYLYLKDEKNKTLSKKYEGTQKEIARIEGIIEQQKTWSQERNYKIIKSKQKVIDRLKDGLETPDDEMEKIKFKFNVIAGGNREVLMTHNLSKSFGDNLLFENVNVDVFKGEKVFVIGPNGCGKTTFLKIIQNLVQSDSGSYLIGSNICSAYYSQMQEEFIENTSVLKFVWDRHVELNQTEVRKALATFLFKGDDVEKSVLDLSGGEKARLSLLLIMLSKSNFLILDEPTNHLDIIAREALENALMDYEGTLLVVSHDRYFINKLASKIYRFDKLGATLYSGNYDDYLSVYKVALGEKLQQDSVGKISYKEKKEKEALERKRKNRLVKVEEEIDSLEYEIKELEALLESEEYATDYLKAMEVVSNIEEKKSKLGNLYAEWEELV